MKISLYGLRTHERFAQPHQAFVRMQPDPDDVGELTQADGFQLCYFQIRLQNKRPQGLPDAAVVRSRESAAAGFLQGVQHRGYCLGTNGRNIAVIHRLDLLEHAHLLGRRNLVDRHALGL